MLRVGHLGGLFHLLGDGVVARSGEIRARCMEIWLNWGAGGTQCSVNPHRMVLICSEHEVLPRWCSPFKFGNGSIDRSCFIKVLRWGVRSGAGALEKCHGGDFLREVPLKSKWGE